MDDTSTIMGSTDPATDNGVSDPLVSAHFDGTLGDDEDDRERSTCKENSGVERSGDGAVNSGKKRHRRKNKGGKHHKKWKPYSKMTWNERKELEEKESKRAHQRVEKRFADGHPAAPYNTTQFLMDDHMTEEQSDTVIDQNDEKMFPKKQLSRDGSGGSWESSDEFYESPNDEEIFLAKNFSDTYDNIHAERMQNMSRDDLVKEYLEMELKVEKLERRTRESENCVNSTPTSTDITNSNVPHGNDNLNGNGNEVVMKLIEEIGRLSRENERLLAENRDMRAQKQHLPFQSYTI